MEPYANFEFYSTTYLLGKEAVLDAASFPFYAMAATREILRYTGGQPPDAEDTDRLRYCCCAVAELLYTAAQEKSSGAVSSEAVGAWSVQYESAEASQKALRGRIREAVYAWLSDTGLLYCGR